MICLFFFSGEEFVFDEIVFFFFAWWVHCSALLVDLNWESVKDFLFSETVQQNLVFFGGDFILQKLKSRW